MNASMNRLANARNPYQGARKKVLCVCSAGLLRSPSMAVVLSQPPFNCNTRAAGIEPEYALIPVDEVLVAWADKIFTAEKWQAERLVEKFGGKGKVVALDIPDKFEYLHPELVEIIKKEVGPHLQ